MDWIPGAERVVGRNAGAHITAHYRAVWHSTEGSSIAGAIGAYRAHGGWPHVTWDPWRGEIVQHLPARVAGRALENHRGGVETNRYGALQIEVVAFARDPFTRGPMVGLPRLLDWLRSNGVRDYWPSGQPLPYPQSYGYGNPQRSVANWLGIPGHFAHSQVPENAHGDPGRIDIKKLLGGGGRVATLDKQDLEAIKLIVAHDVLNLAEVVKDQSKALDLKNAVHALNVAKSVNGNVDTEHRATRQAIGAVDIGDVDVAVTDVVIDRIAEKVADRLAARLRE